MDFTTQLLIGLKGSLIGVVYWEMHTDGDGFNELVCNNAAIKPSLSLHSLITIPVFYLNVTVIIFSATNCC